MVFSAFSYFYSLFYFTFFPLPFLFIPPFPLYPSDLFLLQTLKKTSLFQGYRKVDDLLDISIEDLEDIGFYRLGHQKRLLLGIKKVKDLKKLGQGPPTYNQGPHNYTQGPPSYNQGFQGGQGPHTYIHGPHGVQGGLNYASHGGQGAPNFLLGPQRGQQRPLAAGDGLHYYPQEVTFHSLPPLPPAHHRFSSFHQETTPLLNIREGEVYAPREGEGRLRDGEGNLVMPRPMPPIESVYNNHQQR